MRSVAVAALSLACAVAGAQDVPGRAALLERAESELARGSATAAAEIFERAALMLHAPDTEMGLVRAYMQDGEYRRALAFCAHAAGAHLEAPAAGALYAWLLRAGGQDAYADRLLGELTARAPSDGIVVDEGRAFAAPWPLAVGALLDAPHRMAPYASSSPGESPVPDDARVVSTGVSIDAGRRALVPASGLGLPLPRRIWLRNGLGQTREAWVDTSASSLEGIVALAVQAPFETRGFDVVAPREPFAGSPGFVVEYSASANAVAAWPWLRRGFLGSATRSMPNLRRLGIEVADGPHGGPVFDAAGHLAGIAVSGPGQQPFFLAASSWQGVFTGAGVAASTQTSDPVLHAATPPLIAVDEAYERALRVALQVILAP